MFRPFTRRRPSPATVMAAAALFVALGGAGYAATGGNFLLGDPNTATTPTRLTANIAGKALLLANTSTTSGASALGLTVASGHPPLAVNSGTKVANLNADKLDGLDASALQARVSGSCSGRAAIKSIGANGSVGCEPTSPVSVYQHTFLSPNSGDTFTTAGGPIGLSVGCSGYRASGTGPGLIAINVDLDQVTVVTTLVYTNETLSHKATIPNFTFMNLLPGSHFLAFSTGNDNTRVDGNDGCDVSILEYPG